MAAPFALAEKNDQELTMPRTKKKCAECEKLHQGNATLHAEIDGLKKTVFRATMDLADEKMKAQKYLSMELNAMKDTHRLELIKLIVDGKKAEAVECLLRNDVMLFSIDVRYADTATQIAAKKEQAESLAMVAANAVRSALMPKEEPHG